MAHGKETPRQKMIGMMYLVLMAMLALNVSKDVLNAFVLVDEGLVKTTENFAKKNDVYYQEFDRAAAENPVKAGPWQAKALEVKRKTDELHQYIQELKLEIITTSEGEDSEAIEGEEIHGMMIGAKDDTQIPAQIMIGPDQGGKANDLKAAIEELREYLLSLISEENETVRLSIESNLGTHEHMSHGEMESWQISHFDQMPLIAVITLMSKMQNDVRNAESETLNYLYLQIDEGAFKFNFIEPIVIPKSNHIIRGNEFQANVFMAAFDTTQEPIVYIGDYDSIVADDGTVQYNMVGNIGTDYDTIEVTGGKGNYKVKTSSTGEKKWGGIISLKRMDGSFTNKPFTSSYIVAEPALVVSPTEMNVFYQAIDNPVEISVPGYPASSIRASINNGRMTGSGTRYTVSPTKLGTANVSVSVMVDGQRKSMGTKPFRVEKVPDPETTIAGKKGGTLTKSVVLAEIGLKAEMPEWFKFGGVSYKITSYEFEATIQGFAKKIPVQGSAFPSDLRDVVRNARANSRIYFNDITAVGPDGSTRTLPTLSLKIR
ncbi:gliding motility protein GldM [Bacteroidota bacterium]